ncbi:LysM peptidoglycan-binding domain-containing protein [Litorihabitans aurantiacus]|uniref:LysM domain-containing protein n=1 Tax=Litorihabitans aurantiacus TaxID=1930061 RepID=A0AA37XEE0_9MICO|nr:LysM peptidoglycan-binding domain-containing protein [Litorihabitans aurantiacus]GMA31741.1 hypothetical protein GCM10025875_17330 [Litorihabitans aurantiacus]
MTTTTATTTIVTDRARCTSQARRPAPMRLTRRGRAVLVGLGLAVAAGVGSVAGQAVAGQEVATPTAATTTVVVAPGESLWTIADTIAAPDQDVRDVVSAIADLNDLDGLGVQAGAELLLPAS